MATTYTDDPVYGGTAAQKRDAVRFLAQDHRASQMKVSDAEVAFLIAEEANVYMAAAACAEKVAGRSGNISSKSVGDLSISYGAEHYTTLAKTLRQRGMGYQLPILRGASISGKEILEEDSDAVQPSFARDMLQGTGLTDSTRPRLV